MLPALRKVQNRGRSLYLRGTFTQDELEAVVHELSPAGLAVQSVVKGAEEARAVSEEMTSLWR